MRPSTARIALAAAGLACVSLVGGAHAASKPTTLVITDPAGDGKAPGDDILKVTYTTTGTTKKVGKKVVYTPVNLVMTIETAADINTSGYLQYDIQGTLAGCGDFYIYATPGSALDPVVGSCPDDDAADFSGLTYAVAGRTIAFTLPLGASAFKTGAVIEAPNAFIGFVEPVSGEVGPAFFFVGNDDAASETSYKIG